MLIAHVVGIGMVVSFIFTEIVGLSAGGIIVPGYLAFYWANPQRLLSTLVVSLLTYGIVKLLSRQIILFGRRRFMLSILIGYVVGSLLFSSIRYLPLSPDTRVIGYVIPGLIANDMIKQGVLRTILAVGIVSLIVRLIFLILI